MFAAFEILTPLEYCPFKTLDGRGLGNGRDFGLLMGRGE